MTALDAFALSPGEWDAVEARYEAALAKVDLKDTELDQASQLVADLLQDLTAKDEQKAFALGIIVGRASR
jgi:hypothetical protein